MKTLDDVMEDWEDAVQRGENPSTEELCAECPELQSEVRRQIQALQTFASRFGLLVDGPPGDTDDAQSSRLPMRSIRISTVYQLEKLHATGGLGSVYLAHDEELNRRVALKFPRGSRHSAATRARFEREARITSRLDHPGIVPVHTIHSDAHGQPCYAMRFIEGQTLQEAIQLFHQDRIPGKFTSPLFRDLLRRFQVVCDVVAYSHSQGVVHRDIKPSNIMLGKYGETLLVDWGLAKVLGQSESPGGAETAASPTTNPTETLAGQTIGTAAYASPEQLFGQLEQVHEHSDVFSLGATLFCLLTGEHLLTTVTLPEHLQRLRQGSLPRTRDRNSAVPLALCVICDQALRVNPAARYGSPQDLSRDIDLYLADEPISVFCETWRVRSGRWLRKHPVAAAAVVAAVSVGLVAAISSSFLLQGKNQKLSQTISELDTTNRSLTRAYEDLGNTLVSRNVYRQKYAGALVTSAQSLKALTALSSEVTATFPNRSQIVTETDRPFLVWLRDRFLAYGEQSGATTESLYIRSIGRLHSGSISLSLGDLALAETQLTEAQRTLLTLQAVSPVDVFDQCLAQCCALLGECQLAQGQPDLAIRHFEEALIRFDKFLAGPRARPLLEVRLHRAALLNSLAALHPDGPASEAMQPEWDASRQHLEELFLAGDQKLDVGIVLVETLRLQAQRQKPSPENQAARSLLERARDVTGEMLTLDPRHQRVRFQRAQTLCELSLLIPEQVEQLTTESIQILSVLVTESPAHAPFRQQLSRVLEARYVLRNASGDVNGAAADHELAALLLLPEVSPPEASRAILTKLQTDLTSPRQVLLGGNHTHADVLLEQLIPQIREAVPSHPAGERSVRLVVDALQLRAEVKSYLNQWPEAEALLAEALAAIDSLVQDRRSRLLFAQLRAELSHRRAQILISLHREAEAEPLRALSRAFLEELDLDLTEESLVALHRPVDRGVTGPPSLTTGDQFEDPAGVRSAVDQQRQALMGALEVMRMQFVKANLLPDAGVVWERQQRLTRDALQTQFHNLTFPEPEQGLSPAHWVLDEQGITYVEVQGSTSGFVWGAGPYSDDSDLGTAAVHAGYLQPGEFKFVGIRRRHAQPQFSSSTANGVTTNHSVRFSGSYEIVGAGLRDTLFYGEERSPDAKRFTVLVRGDAGGYAYGTDLYSTDSELSAAAVHLGILQPLELSFIDIEILPGQEKYTGSTRHGLTTRDNGPWHSTFRLSRPSRYRNEPSP